MAETLLQGVLELQPPDPWNGRAPDPPPGAMQPIQVESDAGARGPGRPPGRSNNRAPDMASYIHRRHGSPLEHAARFIAQPIDAIAREMGTDKVTAFRHCLAVMEFEARYIHPEPAKSVRVAARVNQGLADAHYQAATVMSDRLAAAERVAPPIIDGEAVVIDVATRPVGMPSKGAD
jgi:hypothetical protein